MARLTNLRPVNIAAERPLTRFKSDHELRPYDGFEFLAVLQDECISTEGND